MYDSSHTDLIIIRVDNTFVDAAEGGSEAMLSSPSMDDRSQKRKKDKKKQKKRHRCHSSVSSSPGGELARHANRWLASLGQEGGPRTPAASVSGGEAAVRAG